MTRGEAKSAAATLNMCRNAAVRWLVQDWLGRRDGDGTCREEASWRGPDGGRLLMGKRPVSVDC